MKSQTINQMVRLSAGLRDRAELWTVDKRLEMAARMENWAHQLRMSVKVWKRRQHRPAPARLKVLPRRKLALN